ncbi:hypothetical protein BSB_18530 [Bacillus stercoris]|nr:hypothetical protein BSB_18530 [Bacillus stercoris]
MKSWSKRGRLRKVRDSLEEYIRTLGDTEWLFPSRKGDRPITTRYKRRDN